MLKKEYYCLVAGLPDLFFSENKTNLNSTLFKQELKEQLTASDYKLIEVLLYAFDNDNLLNIYFNRDKAFNQLANISKEDIEFQLLPTAETQVLPQYMRRFIDWMTQSDTKNSRTEAENILHALYYEFALKCSNVFLANWLNFELAIKNLLTTFNCTRFDYDLSEQLIKHEMQPEFYSLLLNKRINNPELFEDLLPFREQIFKVTSSDIEMIEKEKALDKIRWDYLDEHTFFHYFTIEKVLSYLIKLLISERWMALEEETGKQLLDKLIEEIKSSYEFPVEFSL